MLVLGVAVLTLQAVCMPVGMVYAETMASEEKALEQADSPDLPSLLETIEETNPRFFFQQSHMTGTVNEPIDVTISSDQEISELRITVPKEAKFLNDQLPVGLSIQPGEQPQEWHIRSVLPQKTFVLPVVFESTGTYEVAVQEVIATMDIYEQKLQSDLETESGQTIDEHLIKENSEDHSEELLNKSESEEESLDTLDPTFPSDAEFLDKEIKGTVTNLLQNPTLDYTNRVSTTIPNWEIITSTTPVNFLTRNVNLIPSTFDSNGWTTLSDSSFQLGKGGNGRALNIDRRSGTRTIMFGQTIDTIQGMEYQFSIRVHSGSSTNVGNITLTAYDGSGRVAGVGALTAETFSIPLDTTYRQYSVNFVAESSQTTVSFRSASSRYHIVEGTSVNPVPRDLVLEASPASGGTPESSFSSLEPGTRAEITANTNVGYRFIRWEIVNGDGALIEDLTKPETTFTMGSEDTLVRAIYEENQSAKVHVYHVDQFGHELAETEVLEGIIGEEYQTYPKEIKNYRLIDTPINATGHFTEDMIDVTYIYETTRVSPVDPLEPETEVEPENRPDLPEVQGLLSIDFVSSFKFGSQAISVHDQTYYAQPQRLLNGDGTVNEIEERPNYVQISDRRSESERNGWELAVTQKEQFKGKENQVLNGASITLLNQQVVTAQGGTAPELQSVHSLIPGNRQTLIKAQGSEGMGTWIYRFGDAETAKESVALNVPKGANPEATSYSTKLTWELSSVPDN